MKMTIIKLANIVEVPCGTIKQVDFKQLFIISHVGYKLYFSYDTCIGIYRDNQLYITDQFYSVTTSKHKGILKRKFRSFIELPVHVFDDLFDAVANH